MVLLLRNLNGIGENTLFIRLSFSIRYLLILWPIMTLKEKSPLEQEKLQKEIEKIELEQENLRLVNKELSDRFYRKPQWWAFFTTGIASLITLITLWLNGTFDNMKTKTEADKALLILETTMFKREKYELASEIAQKEDSIKIISQILQQVNIQFEFLNNYNIRLDSINKFLSKGIRGKDKTVHYLLDSIKTIHLRLADLYISNEQLNSRLNLAQAGVRKSDDSLRSSVRGSDNPQPTVNTRDDLDRAGYVFVPNAFYPESENVQLRTFKPIGLGFKNYHLIIWDSRGKKVFESTELDSDGRPLRGWNGRTSSGIRSPAGIYFWRIEAMFVNGKPWNGIQYPRNTTPSITGNVTLL